MTDPFDAPGEAGQKFDRYGRYQLPDPHTGRPCAYTRATTFAKTISDTYSLDMWGRRMVAKGLAARPDLFAMAAATPLEDRATLDRVCEEAKDYAGGKAGSNLGTALHQFTEQIDRGHLEPQHVPEQWRADVEAYVATVRDAGIEVMPEYIERTVLNEYLGIAGTLDRIARLPDGQLVIFDLKTGRDLSYGWGEISVQLAVYANAHWVWDRERNDYNGMPDVSKVLAIVAHLPVNRGMCTLYDVDIVAGWDDAQLCVAVRTARKRKARALRHEPRRAPNGPVAGVSYGDRIRAATSSTQLSAIYREAVIAGQWSESLKLMGLARHRELSTKLSTQSG